MDEFFRKYIWWLFTPYVLSVVWFILGMFLRMHFTERRFRGTEIYDFFFSRKYVVIFWIPALVASGCFLILTVLVVITQVIK